MQAVVAVVAVGADVVVELGVLDLQVPQLLHGHKCASWAVVYTATTNDAARVLRHLHGKHHLASLQSGKGLHHR